MRIAYVDPEAFPSATPPSIQSWHTCVGLAAHADVCLLGGRGKANDAAAFYGTARPVTLHLRLLPRCQRRWGNLHASWSLPFQLLALLALRCLMRTEQVSVVLTRNLAWGPDRKVNDTTVAVTDGKTVTANPVAYWLDTWYTNVYIGGDHVKRVTGEWLDGGRVLKLETKLALEAQQGDIPVHIYEEYRLSADGKTLKLYELRSTRDEALVYTFTRQ